MLMLDICTYGDDVLRQKTEKITDFDNALGIFVDAMFETLDEEDSGVGLAAPQVGVSKSIFVVSIPEQNIRQEFINPQIIETSFETDFYEEGCLSIPGQYFKVKRPVRIKIQAQNVKGKPFTLDVDGFYARVIQHEADHLEGKLFIDRLSEEDRDLVINRYKIKKAKRKWGRH